MSGPGKEPFRNRVIDRLPFFGRVRRMKGWARRNRFWIYVALAILVIIIVRPLLSIIATVIAPLAPIIRAMVDNPVGRFVFYNVLAILLIWWIWRRVRERVVRVVGLRCMRAFLDGLNLMILDRWDAAIPQFSKVVRWSRWVRLEDAVPEHRDIAADARIKIATCHLRCNRPNEAKAWLLRVREGDMLTEHVRRNHAELRALAYDLNDEIEQETVLKELEKTHSRDKSNRRVLLAIRRSAESLGDLERARAVGRRLVAVSSGRDREEAERDLALLEFRRARQALGEGDRKRVQRALKATARDPRSALMLGDLALEAGDVKGALKAWSRSVSLPVFDRIATLLEDERLSGEKEREQLLKHFPFTGTLLVLAEHHRKRGEYRKARAALDKVGEAAGESFTLLRLYAACLQEEGEASRAADLYRRALSISLS